MTEIRLLLVEDSADDAEMLLYELRRAAYVVEHQRVETAGEMVTALNQTVWDVVIADYSLPRFGGEEALRIVQQSELDIPFIVVSGAIGEERAVEIMRTGAHDYIMKDNLKRLGPVIQRELRDARERSARRAAEEQVYKLSRALEQSASMVMMTDISGVIEYVNQAFTRVTGYQPDEAVGRKLSILTSAPQKVYERIWDTIKTGATWRGEMRNRKKNGESYWAEVVISAIRNVAGEITHFLTVEEDITERKRLEAELRQYTDRLEHMVEERTRALRLAKEEIELILNNTTDAIALAQPNGDMRVFNSTFGQLFGDQVADNVERLLWAIYDEEHLASVCNALVDTIYNRRAQRVEARINIADGNNRDVDLVFIPVRAADATDAVDDGRSGLLVCLHDITPMKEVDRIKSRFVADAVHDLATPISGLTTRLYLLKKSPEKIDDHVKALENQVAHLRDLLGDLRTLSQLDRDQLSLELAACNLNTLAQRVFDTYEPVAINKQQTLTLTTDPDLPESQFDVRRIERVLVNLVSNAINYTPEGKTIQMQTLAEADYLVFSVADQGIGIAPEERSRIFQRFYRTNTARDMQSTGTGLGLAITREIVEMHGGSVGVSSDLGKGSTFTVLLPIVS